MNRTNVDKFMGSGFSKRKVFIPRVMRKITTDIRINDVVNDDLFAFIKSNIFYSLSSTSPTCDFKPTLDLLNSH